MTAYHFGGICVSRWVVEAESFLRAKSNHRVVRPSSSKLYSRGLTDIRQALPSLLLASIKSYHAGPLEKHSLFGKY